MLGNYWLAPEFLCLDLATHIMSGGESPTRVNKQVLMALCTLTLFSSQLDGSSILPFKSYMYVYPGPLEEASFLWHSFDGTAVIAQTL